MTFYVLLAAGLPVWLVLQPRDFINVQVLYAGILAMVAGLVIGGGQNLKVTFPPTAIAEGTANLGLIWPMLFITVACGAISGFHALVATGTTAKQVAKEGHARTIGFNGMLLESLVAVGVLLVVGSMLTQEQYMAFVWPAAPGISNPIAAFAVSLGTLLDHTLHVPAAFGTIFGILLIEGFVVTTLDVAVRLNRYLFEEMWGLLFKGKVPALLRLPWFNSTLAAALMLLFAWYNAFKALWPLFATGNQMLAALSLIAVSAWLLTRKRQAWFTLIPAGFMILTTIASLLIQLKNYLGVLFAAPGAFFAPALRGTLLLCVTDLLLLGLSLSMVALAIHAINQFRATADAAPPPAPTLAG